MCVWGGGGGRVREGKEKERDKIPVTGLVFLIGQSFPDNLSDS